LTDLNVLSHVFYDYYSPFVYNACISYFPRFRRFFSEYRAPLTTIYCSSKHRIPVTNLNLTPKVSFSVIAGIAAWRRRRIRRKRKRHFHEPHN